MQVTYQFSREDYEEVAYVQAARTRRRWLQWAGLAVTGVGFLLLVEHADVPTWLGAALLVCVGLGVLIVPIWGAYDALERGWQRHEHGRLAQPVTFTLDDAGVTKSSSFWVSQVRWEAYGRFEESRGLFVLYYDEAGLDLADVLPKRVFENAADLDAVRVLCRSKLERVRGAFEVQPPRR